MAKKLDSAKRYWEVVDKVKDMIWRTQLRIPAQETVREEPPDSFSPDLKNFLSQKGSHLEMLGLTKFREVEVLGPDVAGMGIFGKKWVCKGDALSLVSAMAQTLQTAFRLNRFVNFQFITFPLTTGEFDVLVKNVGEAGRKELVTLKNDSLLDDATAPTTRALEAILSLKSSSWIPSILLRRLWDTKRENGKRKASSVGGKYANMQRFGDVLKQSLPHGYTGDLAALDKVGKEISPTNRVVRRTVTRQINDDGQTGPTSKQKRGRMAADVWETQKLSKEMVVDVLEKQVDPWMSKWRKEKSSSAGESWWSIVSAIPGTQRQRTTSTHRKLEQQQRGSLTRRELPATTSVSCQRPCS